MKKGSKLVLLAIIPYGHVNRTWGYPFLPFLPSQRTFRDLRNFKNPISDILTPFPTQVTRYISVICLLKHAKPIDFTIKHYVCHYSKQKTGVHCENKCFASGNTCEKPPKIRKSINFRIFKDLKLSLIHI